MQGLIKSLKRLYFDYSKALDAHSIIAEDVTSCIFDLCNSGIDFLPSELMKGNNTTGWLGSDFNKFSIVWPYAWRNFDKLVSQKFDQASIDTNKYTSKMCFSYLKLHNLLPIPLKIDDKRKAVRQHKLDSLNSKKYKKNELKLEYLIRTSYTLMAQLKTSDEENVENLHTCYKQCLHESHHLDQKLKTITNSKEKKPIWNMQCNNVNVPLLIENLKRASRASHMHDGKEFAEKGIQHVKNAFVSKKGKFAGNLMEKLHANKILNHLADEKNSNSTNRCELSNYYVKNCDFLNEKLKRGLPIPFVINENEECLFLFSDGPAKHFVFSNHVKTLMGWNYFDIKYVKNAQSPASLLKKGIVKKCALLATKIEGSTKHCYTGVSNDWLTLNELGVFRVNSDFNYKK